MSAACTVLIAEDDVFIRMNASDILTDAGLTVLEACHAAEALARLQARASTIHVLFTNIQMPGSRNGLELAHRTRSHWPWIGLLITSGRGRRSPAELPIGSRFLDKPYLPAEVIRHVRELAAGSILR